MPIVVTDSDVHPAGIAWVDRGDALQREGTEDS